jgi:hypothetical protein
VFAFRGSEIIGPKLLARIVRRTGLKGSKPVEGAVSFKAKSQTEQLNKLLNPDGHQIYKLLEELSLRPDPPEGLLEAVLEQLCLDIEHAASGAVYRHGSRSSSLESSIEQLQRLEKVLLRSLNAIGALTTDSLDALHVELFSSAIDPRNEYARRIVDLRRAALRAIDRLREGREPGGTTSIRGVIRKPGKTTFPRLSAALMDTSMAIQLRNPLET